MPRPASAARRICPASCSCSAPGVKLVHVPYQGSPQAATDLLAGRVQMMFSPASAVVSLAQAGKLKVLASATAQAPGILPDVPTMVEAGMPDFDTSIWFGLMAPAGTPRAVDRQAVARRARGGKVERGGGGLAAAGHRSARRRAGGSRAPHRERDQALGRRVRQPSDSSDEARKKRPRLRAVALACRVSRPAPPRAEDYPARPVRIVVGFPAGRGRRSRVSRAGGTYLEQARSASSSSSRTARALRATSRPNTPRARRRTATRCSSAPSPMSSTRRCRRICRSTSPRISSRSRWRRPCRWCWWCIHRSA